MAQSPTIKFCVNDRCTAYLKARAGEGNRCARCGERALTLEAALDLTLALAHVLQVPGIHKYTREVAKEWPL